MGLLNAARCHAVLLMALLLSTRPALAVNDCGHAGTMRINDGSGKSVQAVTRVFDDGSIAVRAALAVNPDGGAASYTVGNHGFTYIANGIGTWNGAAMGACDAQCARDFRTAEQAGFVQGTRAFCVYGMEVEPLAAGAVLQSCGSGRRLVGNGLGRPKRGPLLKSVTGAEVQAYQSTTSLQHRVAGQSRYLDSESLPIAVTPSPALLGRTVWVGGDGFHSSFALLGDTGPAFGEGSIALHQLLRQAAVKPQKPGPIPLAQRCGEAEHALRAPFISKPDIKSDRCVAGRVPQSAAEIRAYAGIDARLDFVILGKAALPRKGALIQTEVTPAALAAAAEAAGYSGARIDAMRRCLAEPQPD